MTILGCTIAGWLVTFPGINLLDIFIFESVYQKWNAQEDHGQDSEGVDQQRSDAEKRGQIVRIVGRCHFNWKILRLQHYFNFSRKVRAREKRTGFVYELGKESKKPSQLISFLTKVNKTIESDLVLRECIQLGKNSNVIVTFCQH